MDYGFNVADFGTHHDESRPKFLVVPARATILMELIVGIFPPLDIGTRQLNGSGSYGRGLMGPAMCVLLMDVRVAHVWGRVGRNLSSRGLSAYGVGR